jgi:(p)ppGpp synthase/HD superfamily hydrolase
MRTLEHVPPEKRQRIALETLEIYAAIAHRLGMGAVRRELEDRAFEHAYPEEFAEIKKLVAERSTATFERLDRMARTLRKDLAKNGLTKFHTDYRVKGLWSLHQKLKRKNGDIDKIYDIAALRVVVQSMEDCYRALGLAHNLWQPLPNKIKDYIAFPKPNGYQGLHTTVFTGDGGIVEIQIRTAEMHKESQYGIAAHVAYKEGNSASTGGQSSFDWIKSLLPSFRRDKREAEQAQADGALPRPTQSRYGGPAAPEWLAELGEEADDPEFEKMLKTDIFTHRVFIFTPKGDVVDLPSGCTPLDFAYAIHSDIGDRVYAAKVNGKLVPLDTILHNGDIVEIQTKKTARPTKKWLDFAKTTLARRHIRLALEREEKIAG